MNTKTENTIERRRGVTGVWKFVLTTGEGKILALSAWGTNYEFNAKQWAALPLESDSEELTRC